MADSAKGPQVAVPPPVPPPKRPQRPEQVLRRLYLTLFLRGRSSRGTSKEKAPKSIGSKLAMTLGFYALIGFFVIAFVGQPVFALSAYLHAMTFAFVGMFVAASGGEVLFNKEEADILLHRPVASRTLLWAKIGVLVQVSLWLAGAFNLAGLVIGIIARDGSWIFPIVHSVSVALEALFCTACVVVVYQLCLRWFGRERLEGLMTTAQVVVGIGIVIGAQIVPQVLLRLGGSRPLDLHSWWIAFVPPAWFAGLDDAVAGSGARGSWILALLAVSATAGVVWMAFGRLAKEYQTGLQLLNETVSRIPRQGGRRWLQTLVITPPLRWFLRDSVSRASFVLVLAYLIRDRDVKLRIYPGLAPLLIMPVIFMLQDYARNRETGSFGVALAGAFMGLMPFLALGLLRYSQQWQASDIFRAAPIPGPAPLCHGAHRAVLCLALPCLLVFAVIALVVWGLDSVILVIPGIIALPVFALVPCLGGKAVPFSLPVEEAKSAGRGLSFMGLMLISLALSGIAMLARAFGLFWWLVAIETIIVAAAYIAMRGFIAQARWSSAE